MKTENIPQDNNKAFNGEKKVYYGINKDNNYTTVSSSGWKAEEIVTIQAVDEINRLAQEALERFQKGESSPIEYYMYKNRMELMNLAQYMKSFQWIIKRHFNLKTFQKLSDKTIKKYAAVFNIDPQELRA